MNFPHRVEPFGSQSWEQTHRERQVRAIPTGRGCWQAGPHFGGVGESLDSSGGRLGVVWAIVLPPSALPVWDVLKVLALPALLLRLALSPASLLALFCSSGNPLLHTDFLYPHPALCVAPIKPVSPGLHGVQSLAVSHPPLRSSALAPSPHSPEHPSSGFSHTPDSPPAACWDEARVVRQQEGI